MSLWHFHFAHRLFPRHWPSRLCDAFLRLTTGGGRGNLKQFSRENLPSSRKKNECLREIMRDFRRRVKFVRQRKIKDRLIKINPKKKVTELFVVQQSLALLVPSACSGNVCGFTAYSIDRMENYYRDRNATTHRFSVILPSADLRTTSAGTTGGSKKTKKGRHLRDESRLKNSSLLYRRTYEVRASLDFRVWTLPPRRDAPHHIET
jgi:hypothetical protein